MTPECIKQVRDLELSELNSLEGEGPFTSLTVEQLLYCAIKATDVETVRAVLDVTDWEEIIQSEKVN